jgi:hypothetical protein
MATTLRASGNRGASRDPSSRWLRGLLAAFCLSILALLGIANSGHGSERCRRCGVEREAYRVGFVWVRSWTSTDDRGEWERRGIPVCSEHIWTRTGCWTTDGGYKCYAGVWPPE